MRDTIPDAETAAPAAADLAPIWLFDLDGTILASNSFPAWVRFLLSARAPAPLGRRLVAAARTAVALVARKALRESHDAFKARLQRAWAGLGPAQAASAATLAAQLERDVRPNMAAALAAARGRPDAVLATAAAAEYAAALGRRLGFRTVLATEAARAAEGSNVGGAKRARALAHLARLGLESRPIVFFTDHLEDLPLMSAAARVIWLGPDDEAPAARAALPGGVELIAARGLSSAALLAAAEAPIAR